MNQEFLIRKNSEKLALMRSTVFTDRYIYDQSINIGSNFVLVEYKFEKKKEKRNGQTH